MGFFETESFTVDGETVECGDEFLIYGAVSMMLQPSAGEMWKVVVDRIEVPDDDERDSVLTEAFVSLVDDEESATHQVSVKDLVSGLDKGLVERA